MFWVIRWTDQTSGDDKSIVVEAESQAEAEYMGLKRGIPIVFLGEANNADIADATKSKMLWKYTRVAPYSCFGQSVTTRQVAFFMMAGVVTAVVNLRPYVEHLTG